MILAGAPIDVFASASMYNRDEVTDVNNYKDPCKDPDIISDNQLGHEQVAHLRMCNIQIHK